MDESGLFHVTSAAAQQVLAQAARSGAGSMALRVAARQEPDGSIAYGMGFDEATADDEPMQFDGLMVLLAPGCEPLIQGTVLDFVELEPGAFGFVFIPPQTEAPEPAPARGCGGGGCSRCGGA